MIGATIIAIVLFVIFITLIREAIGSIRKNDLSWAVICSIGSSLIGLLLGVILGYLLF